MLNLIEGLLLESLEKDYLKTQCLISSIEAQFDSINDFIKKSISHIINFHHIFNARILSETPDSDLWDPLPLNYLSKLNLDNYISSKNIIEDFFISDSAKELEIFAFFNQMNKLFEHASHHRAQIVYVMKLNELKPPNFNLVLIQ
jgi:uncharacterized damage-inducible protein DinB